MYSYIDIHSHLNDQRFDEDVGQVIERMHDAKVASIVVGTDRDMSERAIALAEKHPDVWATIAQHPTDTHKEEFDYAIYRKMAEHLRVVAIGECGLDYFWPSNPDSRKDFGDTEEEKGRQRELFAVQIALSLECNMPLMIHGRPSRNSMDAYEDIIGMLAAHPNVSGNVHFFAGNTAIARKFLDMGFTLSFTGVLTFTHDYDEVVRFVPLDSIHAETDAPYVAPIPYRGARNEPAFVVETVSSIARIRGLEEGVLREALVANAQRIFNITAR